MSKVRHIETGEIYDAVKHDGSDEQAKRITHWINSQRGRAQYFPLGTVDFDLHQAFVLLLRESGDHEFVRRGFWVIQREGTSDFFTIFGDDLTSHYEPVDLPQFNGPLDKIIGDVDRAFGRKQEDI
jgi:hypothetical protein